ncbi:MAG: arginine N-succinyltransferase [Burkholderiales bacterium]|nr:arginine N-succinyltransferase [Burkholderiales bacterium]
MLILRPSRIADLPEVQRIADASVIGITSLPPDRDRLFEKIRQSVESFESDRDVSGEETYFFVLEDTATGRLMGTSGIAAQAGFHDRFYSYRNETIVHASPELAVSNRIHALHLCHDLTGYVLLTSFWIDPSLYNTEWPQLLSRARLLFLSEYSQRFGDKIAAENPGVCDDQGQSPFWDAVGRRFFNMDYPQAERLSGGRSKTFIAELMPHYPIYVPLLPPAAQLAIGQLHPVAELPFSILLDEGFDTDTYVDIFDGGPTVEARIATLRTVQGQRRLPVTVAPAPLKGGKPHLIANLSSEDFRATIAPVLAEGGERAQIAPEIATALNLSSGDAARVVPL